MEKIKYDNETSVHKYSGDAKKDKIQKKNRKPYNGDEPL